MVATDASVLCFPYHEMRSVCIFAITGCGVVLVFLLHGDMIEFAFRVGPDSRMLGLCCGPGR